MKIITALLTLSFSLAAAPDCQKNYRFSNRAGDAAITSSQEFSPIVGNSVASGTFDNRATGCNSWIFTYDSEGLSALSIQLEDAPTANGVVGSFVAYAGTVLSGTNPSTVTTSAFYSGTGYFPYIRVNLANSTGTGSMNIQIFGYKTPALIGQLFKPSITGDITSTGGGTFAKLLTVNNGTTGGTLLLLTSSASATTRLQIGNGNLAGFLGVVGSNFDLSSNSSPLSFTTTATAAVVTAFEWTYTPTHFAALGTPSNGTFTYCDDCTVAATCAGSGTGSYAKRLAGAWVCN